MKNIPDDVNEVDWKNWVPKEKAVIVYITNENNLILIHKKTGLGAGKVNAPGGRMEAGETPEEAALRECMEEIGVIPLNMRRGAELSFIFKDGYSLSGYVFFADSYKGKLIETDEAAPFLCPLDSIPYEQMWEDDILWLPDALAGNYVKGCFIFDGDRMVSKKLEIQKKIN